MKISTIISPKMMSRSRNIHFRLPVFFWYLKTYESNVIRQHSTPSIRTVRSTMGSFADEGSPRHPHVAHDLIHMENAHTS